MNPNAALSACERLKVCRLVGVKVFMFAEGKTEFVSYQYKTFWNMQQSESWKY